MTTNAAKMQFSENDEDEQFLAYIGAVEIVIVAEMINEELKKAVHEKKKTFSAKVPVAQHILPFFQTAASEHNLRIDNYDPDSHIMTITRINV